MMNSLRDQYIHEQLQRLPRRHQFHTRAPGDEGPRRSLLRGAARLAGRALIGLGARLLAVGGEPARGTIPLAPYLGPTTYSQN
jgi:hypothetical protein